MLLRIPFRVGKLRLNEFNPLDISDNLTLLFGRETSKKWRKIVGQDAEDIEARLILAALLQAEKQHEQAVDQYRKILALLPPDEVVRHDSDPDRYRNACVHYELGNTLLALGKRQEARAEWAAVLALGGQACVKSARGKLLAHPADGSTPPHHYKLIVVNSAEKIGTEEFESYEAAWPIYTKWKQAIRHKHVMGVGLVDYFPDQSIGTWMELPKNKAEQAQVRELISLYSKSAG